MTKLALSWSEMRETARKIAHSSAATIEATKGREMNTSKSGKTTVQPISIDGNIWGVDSGNL